MSSSDRVQEVLRGIEKWASDPFNESFMFQRPQKILHEFSSNGDVKSGAVLESLTALSTWYASKGIVETLVGKPNTYLCDSFWCDYFHNAIMRSSFQKENQKKGSSLGAVFGLKHPQQPKPKISFNDQGLLLAKAFALGLITEGEAIGRDALIGLKEGRFYGLDQNKLTPFVLSVFAKWKNLPLEPDGLLFEMPEAYRELFQHLTAGPDEIAPAVVSACDFHLSRSKEHTAQETYEFADPVYAIYPVEILFVFRIRQILGLNNPEIKHSLLDSPLGKLPNGNCSVNPSFAPLVEKIKKDFSCAFV